MELEQERRNRLPLPSLWLVRLYREQLHQQQGRGHYVGLIALALLLVQLFSVAIYSVVMEDDPDNTTFFMNMMVIQCAIGSLVVLFGLLFSMCVNNDLVPWTEVEQRAIYQRMIVSDVKQPFCDAFELINEVLNGSQNAELTNHMNPSDTWCIKFLRQGIRTHMQYLWSLYVETVLQAKNSSNTDKEPLEQFVLRLRMCDFKLLADLNISYLQGRDKSSEQEAETETADETTTSS
jgi:4-amino-4-deoxy-L-arabinose transferase-like glycosyltransferase